MKNRRPGDRPPVPFGSRARAAPHTFVKAAVTGAAPSYSQNESLDHLLFLQPSQPSRLCTHPPPGVYPRVRRPGLIARGAEGLSPRSSLRSSAATACILAERTESLPAMYSYYRLRYGFWQRIFCPFVWIGPSDPPQWMASAIRCARAGPSARSPGFQPMPRPEPSSYLGIMWKWTCGTTWPARLPQLSRTL